MAEALLAELRTSDLLIILDNCEHLLDHTALVVRELLDGCQNVHLLLTSRESMGVPGELVWRLQPLGLTDAVSLYEERAMAAQVTVAMSKWLWPRFDTAGKWSGQLRGRAEEPRNWG